jgi:sortase A
MAIDRMITPTPGDSRAWPRRDMAPARGQVSRGIERVLLTIGILSLGYFLYVTIETHLYQAVENRELDAILASAPASRPIGSVIPAAGSTLGRIEIPRLRVSTIVRAGTDARTLRLAVGHIPGTSLPGETGNIGLAGHRDTFFRRLRDIRAFDEIRLVTPSGTYAFEVEATRIVKPNDTWVLQPTEVSMLTLVTCYPFTYVGSAPDRFIVRAVALSSPTHQIAVSATR